MRIKLDASWLSVVNAALSRINQERIETFNDANIQCSLAKDFLDNTVGEVLNMYTWHCATVLTKLTALAIEPVFGWKYQMELPADFIRLKDVDADNDDWELSRGCILSNQLSLNIRYIAYPGSADDLTPLLRSAITARLACKLCASLSSDMGLYQVLMQEAAAAVQIAQKEDGKGRKDIMYETNSWR